MEILKDFKTKNNYPICYGLFKDEKVKIDANEDDYIDSLVEDGFIKTDLGEITKIPTNLENKAIYIIGLGDQDKYDYTKLQKVFRKISFKLNKELMIYLDSFINNLDFKFATKYVLDTICFYNYKFDELKTKKTNNDFSLKLFTEYDIEDIILEEFKLAKAIDNTRDLVNKPYNHLSADDLVEYAQNLVQSLDNKKVNIKVYNKKEIQDMKMNAFLAVNKGSTAEPKLIHITYQGKINWSDPIALVGKGIMFDTGGYSLKNSMNSMKSDMAGAATVLGIFEAAVENKLEVNLSVVICATDNRINGEALLPDDVITAMNGKTIEIVSTDAEGRLTLADAVYFAQKQGSKEVIDFATLTGAVLVALGDYITGLFGNDPILIDRMLSASKEEYEGMWQLPITEHIRDAVRGSKVADLTNSTGRLAGSIGAASFIEEFIEEGTKWMHLDIAGTAFHTSPSYNEFYGATGSTVKTVYKYLKNKE